jgi:hypothetical protein
MASERYTIIADAFALSTTGKTACNIIAGASVSATIVEIGASVAAVTGRCLMELFESTQATAGTVGSSTGAKQIGGFIGVDTVGPNCTYGREYSAEPTVLTVLKSWWFPCPGPMVIQFPLGREPQSLVSGATKYKAIGIRLTVDTGTPNAEAYIEWEE